MKRRLFGLLFAVGAVGVATLSCQVILGLDEPVATSGDAGGEGDSAAALPDGGAGSCTLARPPVATGIDDAPEAESKSYWLAADEMILGLGPDAGLGAGFDLDNGCTCPVVEGDASASCVSPRAKDKAFCDNGSGGVDDAFASIDRNIKQIQPGGAAASATASFRDGRRSLLLYIGDWNGTDNDPSVRVRLISSGGLYNATGCDGTAAARAVTPLTPFQQARLADAGLTRYTPAFDGCDRFSPFEGTTEGKWPSRVPFAPQNAFVTNGTLVVAFDSITASLFGKPSTLAEGYGVAKLSFVDGRLRADAIIAGRIAYRELVDSLGRAESGEEPVDPNDPEAGTRALPLCRNPLYSLATQYLCDARDIRSVKAQDFKGLECDALSIQVGFTMREAQVDDVAFDNEAETGECTDPPPECDSVP